MGAEFLELHYKVTITDDSDLLEKKPLPAL